MNTPERNAPFPFGGITSHSLWMELLPYIEIQECAHNDGYNRPRIRIEFRRMPADLAWRAQQATMPCVACGQPIHFVRQRRKPKVDTPAQHLYYACAHPVAARPGCSKGAQAREDYIRVRDTVALYRRFAKLTGKEVRSMTTTEILAKLRQGAQATKNLATLLDESIAMVEQGGPANLGELREKFSQLLVVLWQLRSLFV